MNMVTTLSFFFLSLYSGILKLDLCRNSRKMPFWTMTGSEMGISSFVFVYLLFDCLIFAEASPAWGQGEKASLPDRSPYHLINEADNVCYATIFSLNDILKAPNVSRKPQHIFQNDQSERETGNDVIVVCPSTLSTVTRCCFPKPEVVHALLIKDTRTLFSNDEMRSWHTHTQKKERKAPSVLQRWQTDDYPRSFNQSHFRG